SRDWSSDVCSSDLTTLLLATKVPCAPSAGGSAAATACTRRQNGCTSSRGRSTIVSTCPVGTMRTWPGNKGRWSSNPTAISSRNTIAASTAPATTPQNTHALDDTRATVVADIAPGWRRHPPRVRRHRLQQQPLLLGTPDSTPGPLADSSRQG